MDNVCCCEVCGVNKLVVDLVEFKIENEVILMCLQCYVGYTGMKKSEHIPSK